MATATCEIYRTESGSTYEVVDGRIRCAAPPTATRSPGREALASWTPYTTINRLPAALLRPGSTGEVLEIVLASGKRVYTSRLVPPVG